MVSWKGNKTVTVEQFDSGEVKLIDEWFKPVFRDASLYDVPFKKLVAFKGQKTGILLHPDFDDVLEIR